MISDIEIRSNYRKSNWYLVLVQVPVALVKYGVYKYQVPVTRTEAASFAHMRRKAKAAGMILYLSDNKY